MKQNQKHFSVISWRRALKKLLIACLSLYNSCCLQKEPFIMTASWFNTCQMETWSYVSKNKTAKYGINVLVRLKQICGNEPPQCSSHTVNRLVLLVSSGSRLLLSITTAWGIIMTQDTTQIITILLRARLAVLLNISGWQIAYQRSWAMQLSVSTETETEMVWNRNETEVPVWHITGGRVIPGLRSNNFRFICWV